MKKITIAVPDSAEKLVTELFSVNDYSTSFAASEFCTMMANVFEATVSRENLKIFTESELADIAAITNTWVIDSSVASDPRGCMLRELEDYFKLEKFEDFDPSFRAKFEGLTHFQALVILLMAKKLWADTDTLFAKLKYLFGATE